MMREDKVKLWEQKQFEKSKANKDLKSDVSKTDDKVVSGEKSKPKNK